KTITKKEADLSIRVSTDKLDQLVNNIGELVIINSQLSFVAEDINHFLIKKLIANIDKLSKNLRDNALDLRLIPISTISLKFKRLVRDLCTKLNKKVDFVTVGGDTQLDSNIIKAIESPLMHIIRNSLDHGVETPEERIQKGKEEKGIIRLIAFYSGANVFIQVQDDGKGINKDYIRQKAIEKGLINPTDKLTDKELYDLIFVPGFSTAQNLTDVSGRGVGMDVVKRNIHELRGMIEIDSEIDLGTSVSLKVPLSLSIIDTLLVEIDDESFLVPINTIESCHKVMHADLISSNNQQYKYQNQLLPYVYLRSFFDFGTNPPEKENMVILSANDRKYGLVVDKVIGEFQAVVKPLGVLHKKQQFLTGASVLGNGNLALIIDTNKIAEHIKETELKRDY
ncbi:MAG: chemotaxis protein CheA, partial [Bacteroidales bacterium]|nr:chemotaxis protein CheA [Bacteroidales bacterium]